jgi:hypothetical protein
MFRPVPGRVRGPRRGRRRLQRGKNPGEDRPSCRGNPTRCERTRGRIKASKWVKLAERSGFVVESRVTGKRVFGRVERELIVVGGSRRPRLRVREWWKPAVIRLGGCGLARR